MVNFYTTRLLTQASNKLPLRVVLIVPFVLQVVATVGLVGYLSYKNSQQAVRELSHQLQNQISLRIDRHLDDYLQMPHLLNHVNQNAMQQSFTLGAGFTNHSKKPRDISLNPPLQQPRNISLNELERFFVKQIRAFESVPYTAWGNEKGEYIGIERLPDRTLHIEVVDDPKNPKYYTYAVNNSGERGKLLQVTPFYDPRTRPWYQNAVLKGKATWSPIYVWFNQAELAIDANLPVYDQKGQIIGVLDTPLKLSRIGDYLQQLKFSRSGQSFIIDRSGLLIASSGDSQPFIIGNDKKPQRIEASNSRNPLIQSTAKYLNQYFGDLNRINTSNQLEFTDNNQRLFVHVFPCQDGRGIDWLVVLVIPETDFMDKINANNHTTIMLVIAAAIGSIISGICTARRVTEPILRLNQAAKELAIGEWDVTMDDNRSARSLCDRADELGELATSFNQMAAQLKAIFQSLTKSEERLAKFFENIPVGISIHNDSGRIEGMNRAGIEILDRDITDIFPEDISSTYQVYIAGTDQLYPTEKLPNLRALKGETVFTEDIEIHRPDGKIVPLEVRSIPVFDESGNVIYAITTFSDISDRKKMERLRENYERELERQVIDRTKALQESEERFRRSFEDAAIGMALVSPEGRWLMVNNSVCDIVGYSEEELLSKMVTDITHPDDLEQNLEYRRQILAGEISSYQMEKRYFHKQGHIVWVLLSVTLVRDEEEQPLYFIAQIQDISSSKVLEREIALREAQLNAFFATAPLGMMMRDRQLRCVQINQVMADINGLPLEVHIGKTMGEILPDLAAVIEPIHQRVLDTGVAIINQEMSGEIPSQPGILRHWLVSSFPIFDPDGKASYLGVVVVEISDRKQVEAKLQEAQRIAHIGSWEYDVATGITNWSEELYRIYGLEQSKIAPQAGELINYIHPEARETYLKLIEEKVYAGQPFEADIRIIRPDGSIRYVETRGEPVFNDKGEMVRLFGTTLDISDRKQAQITLQNHLAVIEAATEGIAILNQNSEYTYLNKAHATIFGYSDASELIGKTWKELYYPEEISRFERELFPILIEQKRWQGEATAKKKDGTTF
ncbi:MAG TPA: hypothetical protein DCY88_00160, partial [Cyanobacteria bacterium UBA11372]|nr:hypothetical protein [Cyanobacteria bacterium UBA11372]